MAIIFGCIFLVTCFWLHVFDDMFGMCSRLNLVPRSLHLKRNGDWNGGGNENGNGTGTGTGTGVGTETGTWTGAGTGTGTGTRT